ncbi:MAG: BLUF domain-containing protein [Acetobacteraceae bacterium]|nr:BLUF domain-containing protein [Acetobacteraceae bacterium]
MFMNGRIACHAGDTSAETVASSPATLPSRLFRLIYVSRATAPDEAQPRREVEAIAAASTVANARDGLTGALAVGGGYFAQILEGPRGAVSRTLDRILADPRHEDIRILDFTPIAGRGFAGWGMSFVGEVDPSLLAAAVDMPEGQERRGGRRPAAIVAEAVFEALAGQLRSPQAA